MVNFLDKTPGERRDPGPRKAITSKDVLFTFCLLALCSLIGAPLGTLFGEAYQSAPFWMTLIPVASAILFGWAHNPKSAVGRLLSRIITILSRRYQAPPSGDWPVSPLPVLMGALVAGVMTAFYVSFEVLDGVVIHPGLLIHPDYGTPLRLWLGGLSGAAVFVFRRILWARWGVIASTARGWTTRDLWVDSTPKKKASREVEGVYWQCPACRERWSLDRKKCPCGKTLNFLTFFSVKRFWVHYRYPDGSDRLEFSLAFKALFSNLRVKGTDSKGNGH